MFAIRPSVSILPPLKLSSASRFLSTLPPPPSFRPPSSNLLHKLTLPSKPLASASSRSYARHVSGGGKGPYGYGQGAQAKVQAYQAHSQFEQAGGWRKVGVISAVVAASVVASNGE